MSVYVVDASVAAKWYFKEAHTDAARRVLAGTHRLHAPDLFLLETDSLLCKRIRRGDITEADGDEIRAAIRQVPMLLHESSSLSDPAYEMAKRTRRSPYDCLYVALAVLLGGQMVTADLRLYEALAGGPFGKYVLWVEDVP